VQCAAQPRVGACFQETRPFRSNVSRVIWQQPFIADVPARELSILEEIDRSNIVLRIARGQAKRRIGCHHVSGFGKGSLKS
jgi:hypothetical protein